MKKTIIKMVYYIAVFVLSCVIIGIYMNKGNDDMTAKMPDATFPVITMEISGQKVDCLRGYAEQMQCQYMRDNLITIGDSREIDYQIESNGRSFQDISFEVRSIDGQRLIENTKVKDYKDKDGLISGKIVLKDLIEPEQEYMLVYLLTPSKSKTIRYYTRVMQTETDTAGKLKFIREFHDATFDKKRAEAFTTYLESDSTGDNTTYNNVNIHSSFAQITWGNLGVKQETEPIIDIREINGSIGIFSVSYMVSTGQDAKARTYYHVNEYYRIRQGKDRIYLLDYERHMEQLFDDEASAAAANTLNIGIESKDMPFVESDGGNVFAFVNAGTLFSYNVTDNRITRIFGFRTQDMTDLRTNYNDYGIKILNVDETGNVQFAVYGYMERGIHEGHVGVNFYSYSSMQNTVEENVFIDFTKSVDILSKDVEKLAYVNKSETCYVMLDGSIYAIDMTTRGNKKIVSGLNDSSLKISGSGMMAAWQDRNDPYKCIKVTCMNLNDGTADEITSGSGEYIMPLGFMKENLVYGIARASDIVSDSSGSVTFPMYRIVIVGDDGKILKTYEKQGIYTVSCEIDNNQMSLTRVKKDDKGGYVNTDTDQITDTDKETAGDNIIKVASNKTMEDQIVIQIKREINPKTMKHLAPRMVIYEGSRETDLKHQNDVNKHYYVYGLLGLEEVYEDPAEAVNKAYTDSGIVLDDEGRNVWMKADKAERNQIMAIKACSPVTADQSTAICLDTILKFNGISLNSQYMVEQGTSVEDILGNNVPNITVLDLTGCSLDAVMYYVDNDIPVLALRNDKTAVLLTGFNSTETVVFDPAAGTLSKVETDKLSKELTQSGCSYITYIRTND